MTRISELQDKASLDSNDVLVIEDGSASYVTKKVTGAAIAAAAPVQSVNDRTGEVTITKFEIGLGSVENTALSTWAGSTGITTLGTISTGTVPAANVSGLAASATTNALNASNISSGTLNAARLPSVNLGTTSVDLTRASGSLTLNGVSIDGNAGTVSNGVYTTGSYSDPSWLTISKSKVGLSNVENTALSTWAGSSNITTIGTISSGSVPAARVSGLAASATTDTTNASNISSGTLNAARLPSVLGSSQINGSLQESTDSGTTYWNAVTQQDIGTSPNQIPLNQHLGTMAFQSAASINVGQIGADSSLPFLVDRTERFRIDTSGLHTIGSQAGSGVALSTTAPAKLYLGTGTYTDTATATSGTVSHGTVVAFDNPAIDSTNATVTYTNASTVYIDGAPTGTGNVTVTNGFALYVNAGRCHFGGSVLSASPTDGIGYKTGAGGTVTQGTSRTTGVTLNKICGSITLFSAAGSVSWQTFTVTNSTVAATDTVRICQQSGTDKYMMHVTKVAAGSFDITYATTGGTTTEQPVFNFSVIKAVSA